MKDIKSKYRRFREWEKQPHQVAPLSDEARECATCGTHYTGNYCPRCGQSSRIARYSFKNAVLLFLDVWGLGNRGMFRSIRDLLLRPGYMIRDYLRGMQMAYFPPFKMYFLLFTLSLVIDSGLNIKGINRLKEREKTEVAKGTDADGKKAEVKEEKTVRKTGKPLTKEERKELAKSKFERALDDSSDWADQHISFVWLIILLLFSCPLWLLFRHGPAIPDLRFSECFVAMVYISNMLSIYGLVPSLFCFGRRVETIYAISTLLLMIVPIKQLTGFSYWSTIWRLPLALVISVAIFLLLFVIGAFIYFFIVVN